MSTGCQTVMACQYATTVEQLYISCK
uniref:Uncharacterized protein n=1 Tax=Arundo donax TaxID=35708 RepID=A0A0A8Z6D2_ARUDO